MMLAAGSLALRVVGPNRVLQACRYFGNVRLSSEKISNKGAFPHSHLPRFC